MRLLSCGTDGTFKLTREFTDGESIPRYAILSHRWLPPEQEIKFEDIKSGRVLATSSSKPESLQKLLFCSRQALKDRLDYFWIDTCCINKSNNSEVQEAVVSMFRWYRDAAKCYAYLSDVFVSELEVDRNTATQPWQSAFRKSQWFTRGWTLQELLAPSTVEFFSAEGTQLGNKKSLAHAIQEVTSIPLEALRGEPLAQFSVEKRMGWADRRQTTRPEDRAYSLLGVFAVFMTLIYGEGEDSAFFRLRGEIERKSDSDRLLRTLPTSPSAAFDCAYHQHEPLCLKGTRIELLDNIRKWTSGSDDRYLYWLRGTAGTGKSTVARTVAKMHHDLGILGGSFLFSKGAGGASQAGSFFTTLAAQLSQTIPATRRHICEVIRDDKDIVRKRFRDQWEQLILNPLAKVAQNERPPTIIFVLDALDECSSSQDISAILRLLAMTDKLKTLRLRVFVTSRPDIEVRREFSWISKTDLESFILHEVPSEQIDRDLRIFFDVNLKQLQQERQIDPSWPSAHIVTRLVKLSCGLFIWADTAHMYIRGGKAVARDRANKLLNGTCINAGPHKHLDQLYMTVLGESTGQVDPDEEERAEMVSRLKRILGTIAILRSRLSARALANLLSIELETVKDSLADLHAILDIPSDDHDPIKLHHPSFQEFLLDRKRCSNLDFWVDEKNAHKTLARDCIRLMASTLQRNICKLESPGNVDRDVADVLISRHLPPEVQYACLQWVEHSRKGQMGYRDKDVTDRFLKTHFLHWVEVLSLIGKPSEMAAEMRLYQALLSPKHNSEQIPFIVDTRRFMLFAANFGVEHSPLQVYCAALLFIPPSNQLRRRFQIERYPLLKHVQIVRAAGQVDKHEYNMVSDIAFSPNGRTIAAGSLDGTVRLWSADRRSQDSKLDCFPAEDFGSVINKISSVAFSQDGKLLAAGSDDFSITIWDVQRRTLCKKWEAHAGWVNGLAFSEDGKYLASCSMDETIRLWNVGTWSQADEFKPGLSCINSISLSTDGYMAVGAYDAMIHIIEIATGKTVHRLDEHVGPVNCVDFSPKGDRLVSGSDDMTVRLWDTRKGTALTPALKGHTKKVWKAVFSKTLPIVASGSEDKSVRIWNAENGHLLKVLRGSTSGISGLAISRGEGLLAALAFNDEVRIWHPKNWEPRDKLPDFAMKPPPPQELDALDAQRGHSAEVTHAIFAPDGCAVATGSSDGTIMLWTRKGKHLFVLQGLPASWGAIKQLVFSPDGQLIAATSSEDTTRLWHAKSGKLLHNRKLHPDTGGLITFASQGRDLATSTKDHTIRLWDTRTGTCRHTLRGHSDVVNGLAFSRSDRLAVSCSADRTIRIWHINPGADAINSRSFKAHAGSVNSVALSADGNQIVTSSSDSTVKLWTVTGTFLGVFKGHTGQVNSAAMSPDMRQVVSSSNDGTIRLWDRETMSLMHTYDLGVCIRSVFFSECGRYIQTDRGLLNITPPALIVDSDGPPPNQRQNSTAAIKVESPMAPIYVSEDWVTHDGQDVIRLPDKFKATCVAVHEQAVVLSHASGGLSFFEFWSKASTVRRPRSF